MLPASPADLPTPAFKAKLKSTPWSHWFYNISESNNTGFKNYTSVNNSIFADSTVQVLYGDGNGGTKLGNCFTQGVGEIFDPTSQIYDTFLSKYNVYTVDSVELPYLYHYVAEKGDSSASNPDGLVHDTLIFQFYTVNTGGIALANAPADAAANFPTENYGDIKYNYKTNLGSGAVASAGTFKYVLGQKDTQSTVINAIVAPVGTNGLTIKKLAAKTGFNSDLFAYTVSYRPGFKYNKGDTIDEQFKDAPIAHPHSHFRIFYGNYASTDPNTDYEMNVTCITPTRYNLTSWNGQNSTGYDGHYIAGALWFAPTGTPGVYNGSENQILWSLVHATTSNLGIEGAGDQKGYALSNVYPNPANGSARIDFTIANPENVTITVYDILGHELTTLAKGSFGQGTHTINFNTQNWKTGLYLYSITAGSYTKTLKFTVSE